jgi:hypothetical protein
MAGHIEFELRYPTGSKSTGVAAINSAKFAETSERRLFAFELWVGEYEAAAMTCTHTAGTAVCRA